MSQRVIVIRHQRTTERRVVIEQPAPVVTETLDTTPLTIAETCERIGCSEFLLRRWEHEGLLVPMRDGAKWTRYLAGDVEAFKRALTGRDGREGAVA